jgi:hypothetical protein
MFLSKESRILQVYSAVRQIDTSDVAYWHMRCVNCDKGAVRAGLKSLNGFWEIICPFEYGDRVPEGWHDGLHWFRDQTLHARHRVMGLAESASRDSAPSGNVSSYRTTRNSRARPY